MIKVLDQLPEYLQQAISFDKSYFPIPIKECGEPFLDLQKEIRSRNLTAVFNDQLTSLGTDRWWWIRQSLLEPIIQIIHALARKNLVIKFEYVFRTLEEQRQLFEDSVKQTLRKYPKLDKQTILDIAGIYVACTPGTSAHLSGAAVDITLLDKNLNPVDMGAGYLEIGPQTTTNSQAILKTAQKNRRLLCRVMSEYGFSNYPYEFWHFSSGDRVAARIQNVPVAKFGPMQWDKKSNNFYSIKNADKPFNVNYLTKYV